MFNGQLDTFTVSVLTLKENNFDFGLDKYPIFDENYREILNNSILNFYIMHEIGWHNPAVFRHFLSTRMDIIMRNKYNALYIAKSKDFNPMYTLDVFEETSHTVENKITGEVNVASNGTNNTVNINDIQVNTDSTSDNSNDALALASNYPSEDMANNDLTSNVYINNGQKNTNNANSKDNTKENTKANNNSNTTIVGADKTTNVGNNITTETYNKRSYGSASDLSFAHAMIQFKEYCDNYNLDQQIIDELKDLFINIY